MTRNPQAKHVVTSRILAIGFLFLALIRPPAAESETGSPRPGVSAIKEAFKLSEPSKISAALEKAAQRASTAAEKSAILVALADLEERLGNTVVAAAHYHDAAYADPAARNDALLLDSARCLLESGDITAADAHIRSVLLGSFEASTLMRARAYATLISLTGPSANEESAALARSLADNPQFAQWAPALLLTLWWTRNDEGSRKALLARWPASPEAAIVTGKIGLSPAPFWYLAPRDEKSVASFASAGIGAGSIPAVTPVSAAAVKPVPPPAVSAQKDWQQAGFFKNREYADDLVKALAAAGFTAEIREEKRPSGTLYYAVLVPEDAARHTAERLKDAGFESYLVTD